MKVTEAIRWTASYKAASWLAGIVAIGLAITGLYLGSPIGFPLTVSAATSMMASFPFVILALLGFLGWQVVSTIAFYKTISQAARSEVEASIDLDLVKGDILSVLDERLADMQTQIEGTRRAVEKIDSGGETTSGIPDFDASSGTGGPPRETQSTRGRQQDEPTTPRTESTRPPTSSGSPSTDAEPPSTDTEPNRDERSDQTDDDFEFENSP